MAPALLGVDLATLLVPVAVWFTFVDKAVTGPYLDEYFHVRQAKHYCNASFDVWDPKITTPSGLYLLSTALRPILGCSITSLRLINAVSLIVLYLTLRATYLLRRDMHSEAGFVTGLQAAHSSLNICLFPPLFFFSALYYTDVPSTLSVATFYWYFLRGISRKRTTARRIINQILLGVSSLMFRQTNIFWVAIFPAALTFVVELDHGHAVVKQSMHRRAEGFGDTMLSVVKTSWKHEVVYDPPARDAFIEDYARALVSIATCSIKAASQPKRLFDIIGALAPYLSLIALFGGFIIWNGGVVLGDKSNHVATINLPQMLYLWPFIAFFSWPMLAGHFVLLPIMHLSRLTKMAGFEPLISFRRRSFLPRLRLIMAFTAVTVLVIHFNTVVHPFMRADNRHYVFYVFKRLLQPWWLKYLVAPIYVVAGWACLDSRGEPLRSPSSQIPTGSDSKSGTPSQGKATNSDGNRKKDSSSAQTASETIQSGSEENAVYRPVRLPEGKSTAMVSFIIVFIATTALSLCTAPLVEPRYYIVPYIIWRLHLPLSAVSDHKDKELAKSKSVLKVLQEYDWAVAMETVWFLAINAATGYIFLNWTFRWASEPLSKQRFMW